MSTITRMWLGFAALCAGIVHLALIVSSPVPVAVVLAVLGLVECAWGILTFVRPRVFAPRVVLWAALAPTVLWGTLVAAAAASQNPGVASYLGFTALAIATVFSLFISIVLAVHLRRGTDFSEPTRAVSAPVYLVGVFAGGLIAAILVTPALSATDAGKFARPMSDMNMNFGAPTVVLPAPIPSTSK